jgi:hypothetical protein
MCKTLGERGERYERGQTKREQLVLQEWGFCGRVGNPPKENKVLKSKDAQPWSNASMPEQVKGPNPWRKMMMMTLGEMCFIVRVACSDRLRKVLQRGTARTVVDHLGHKFK